MTQAGRSLRLSPGFSLTSEVSRERGPHSPKLVRMGKAGDLPTRTPVPRPSGTWSRALRPGRSAIRDGFRVASSACGLWLVAAMGEVVFLFLTVPRARFG